MEQRAAEDESRTGDSGFHARRSSRKLGLTDLGPDGKLDCYLPPQFFVSVASKGFGISVNRLESALTDHLGSVASKEVTTTSKSVGSAQNAGQKGKGGRLSCRLSHSYLTVFISKGT